MNINGPTFIFCNVLIETRPYNTCIFTFHIDSSTFSTIFNLRFVIGEVGSFNGCGVTTYIDCSTTVSVHIIIFKCRIGNSGILTMNINGPTFIFCNVLVETSPNNACIFTFYINSTSLGTLAIYSAVCKIRPSNCSICTVDIN